MTCIAFDRVHAFMTDAIAMAVASSATGLQHRGQAYSITPIQNVFMLPLMSLKSQSKTVLTPRLDKILHESNCHPPKKTN